MTIEDFDSTIDQSKWLQSGLICLAWNNEVLKLFSRHYQELSQDRRLAKIGKHDARQKFIDISSLPQVLFDIFQSIN